MFVLLIFSEAEELVTLHMWLLLTFWRVEGNVLFTIFYLRLLYLRLLHMTYTSQMTRQRINEMRRTSTLAEPWLKRFMSMAQAMYDFDENRTGIFSTPIIFISFTVTRSRNQGWHANDIFCGLVLTILCWITLCIMGS